MSLLLASLSLTTAALGLAVGQAALSGAPAAAPAERAATDTIAQGRAAPPACSVGRAPAGTNVLVFSRTKGFRHGSIPKGIAAVKALGARHGFAVEATEDAALFTDASLRRFSAVAFLNTTGDVLDSAQQASFERYIRRGGGFVGIHSATDTEYDWPWYGQLVGAYFRSHPRVAQATVIVRSRDHPSTKCLEQTWTRTDEWYDFRAQPVKGAHVLATLDETTYSGGRMGALHPVVWYQRFQGGRSFYTEMGHTDESYAEPAYLTHLAGGILWAAAK